MKKEQVALFKSISEICGSLPVYIYGKTLLFLYLGKEPSTIDLFIQSKNVDENVISQLKTLNEKITVSYGKEITFFNEIFTVNCIYCELNNVLNQAGNIDGKYLALNDLHKRNIRFIDKEASSKNPKHVLEAILFSNETEFNLEVDTLKQIFVNRKEIQSIVKRDLFHFIRNLYMRSVKPRKAVALFNTLGLSTELFGVNLVESAVLNNLGKKDVNEFFALIFNNIDYDQLETFLVEKAGFHLRDVEKVLQVTHILNEIQSQDHNSVTARKILRVYGKDRALNLYRLFRAIGLNDLAQIVKNEKNSPIDAKDLCVDLDFIMRAFNVDQDKAKKLLDLALDIVIMHPELNEPSRLLSALNKQKTNKV